MEKLWTFIKENVAVIITVATALLTIVYATLRLCIYIYWSGYFCRLNIDNSIMNLDFDKTIFAVVFVSIIVLIVTFFMSWTYDVLDDEIKKIKQNKKLRQILKSSARIGFFSFIILSIVNASLVLLLSAVLQMKSTIGNMSFLFVGLYVLEMFFIFSQKLIERKSVHEDKEKERKYACKIMQVIAVAIFILVMLFYVGNNSVEQKTQIQLVGNENYAITYCNGDSYVLHKVKYEDKELIIYKNEQKIVSVNNLEYSIKPINKIIIED